MYIITSNGNEIINTDLVVDVLCTDEIIYCYDPSGNIFLIAEYPDHDTAKNIFADYITAVLEKRGLFQFPKRLMRENNDEQD